MKYNNQTKQLIINLVRSEYERAEENFRHAHAERVGMDAAANVWDDFNKNDGVGGISENPYNTLTYITKEDRAKVYASKMKEAYNCVVDTFILE